MPESTQISTSGSGSKKQKEGTSAKDKFLQEISNFTTEGHISSTQEFTNDQLTYTVTEPMLVNKVMKYTVKGHDSEG
jgi:hypothetical protein